MGERIITEEIIQSFHQYLVQEEKSTATIEKYLRDVRTFSTYIGYRMSSDEDILIPEDQFDLMAPDRFFSSDSRLHAWCGFMWYAASDQESANRTILGQRSP